MCKNFLLIFLWEIKEEGKGNKEISRELKEKQFFLYSSMSIFSVVMSSVGLLIQYCGHIVFMGFDHFCVF